MGQEEIERHRVMDFLSGMRNVVVDIDGVVASLSQEIWTPGSGPAEPLPDARRALELLHRAGFRVVLYTARPSADRQATTDWLKEHRIPFDELHMDKPRNLFLVDDRAIRFVSWPDTLKQIRRFQEGLKERLEV